MDEFLPKTIAGKIFFIPVALIGILVFCICVFLFWPLCIAGIVTKVFIINEDFYIDKFYVAVVVV